MNPMNLGTFPADAARQLNILGHDGNTLGVNSTQVGIFKETNEVGFRSFLQGQDSGGLEAQVVLEVLRNLADQALEGSLAD